MRGPNDLRPWTAEDEANVSELEAMIERHLADDNETTISVTEVKREVLDRVVANARKAGWRAHLQGFAITVSR